MLPSAYTPESETVSGQLMGDIPGLLFLDPGPGHPGWFTSPGHTTWKGNLAWPAGKCHAPFLWGAVAASVPVLSPDSHPILGSLSVTPAHALGPGNCQLSVLNISQILPRLSTPLSLSCPCYFSPGVCSCLLLGLSNPHLPLPVHVSHPERS